MALSEIVSDPLKLVSFVTGEGDLKQLASVDNFNLVVLGMMKSMLISHQELAESNKLVAQLNSRVVALEEDAQDRDLEINKLKTDVANRDRTISDLQDRTLGLEEYSRRSTVTLTNVPYSENENLGVKVIQLINQTKILTDGLDLDYVSHVHRNKRWTAVIKPEDKPPTVTLQFVRAMDKDIIMENKSKWKAAHGSGVGKVNILHAMCPRIYNEMKALNAHKDVDFADYRGHLRHFAVKMNDTTWVKNIRGLQHLKQEIGI